MSSASIPEWRIKETAHLNRLTALAREVWPDAAEVSVQRGLGGSDPYTAFARVDGDVLLDIAAPNELALEALEAALWVLRRRRVILVNDLEERAR